MSNKKSKRKKQKDVIKNERTPLNKNELKPNIEENIENRISLEKSNKEKSKEKEKPKKFSKKDKTENKKSKKENKRIQTENRELKNKLKKVEQENKELKEHLLKIEKTLFELTEKINKLEEEKRLAEEKSEKFRRKIKLTILQLIIAGVIIFSIVALAKSKINASRTGKLSKDLRQYITEIEESNVVEAGGEEQEYTIDFEQLRQINPDTRAWLKIESLNLDFPVVQANDNDYYLKYSFDRTRNSDGWVFFDYRNLLDGTDKNTIIYAHNRKNGNMFSNLVNILDSSWYDNEENRYFNLYIGDQKYTYEVFSIYQIKVESYYIQTYFNSNQTYLNFLNTIKSRSIKDYGIELTETDNILTLSTCGSNSKYRVVLHARRI